ncbi:MAG TPA: hypothetical protein PKD37_04095 [Oligoflexia bacterium]|nr:hypothetical protein [Oligoflexia bacterium]HMP27148.1 hypothetical protein [Oligoflexia bacterium]
MTSSVDNKEPDQTLDGNSHLLTSKNDKQKIEVTTKALKDHQQRTTNNYSHLKAVKSKTTQDNCDTKASPNKSPSELEFTAKEAQAILRKLTNGEERIGLALLNYYSRSNLVPATGKEFARNRQKYSYGDIVLLCWLFRMKAEGLPVGRFRQGLDYLKRKLPKLVKNPTDMILLTDGKQLFLRHRIEDRIEIAENLTGKNAGQYCWTYAIGSLIKEIDSIIEKEVSNKKLSRAKVA